MKFTGEELLIECNDGNGRLGFQKLLSTIAAGGIKVPAPVASATDKFLHVVDGVQVDVLTWLSGSPVSAEFALLNGHECSRLFSGIDRTMAMLHEISDAWLQPEGFTRCAWDRDGLLGRAPLWNRFWDNPTLSPKDRELFSSFRKTANIEFAQMEGDLDYGLIHADLVGENVIIDGDTLQLIDS